MKKWECRHQKWHRIHCHKQKKRKESHNDGRDKTSNHAQQSLIWKKLLVPSKLDTLSNPQGSLKLYSDIRKYSRHKKKTIFLDFSRCTEISIEACIVLAAEVNCSKNIGGNYPIDRTVYAMLNELGFFKLLKVESNPPNYTLGNHYELVPVKNGRENSECVKDFQNMILPYDPCARTENNQNSFKGIVYSALTEAMANIEHAYPESENYFKTENQQWWCAAVLDKKNKRVFFVLYDKGIGIPKSFTKKHKIDFEKLKTFLKGKIQDSDKIDRAMQIGATSTTEKGRGRGLNQMKNLIYQGSLGELCILSNLGKCVYSSENENCSKETLPHAIKGTLLIWLISLNEKQT